MKYRCIWIEGNTSPTVLKCWFSCSRGFCHTELLPGFLDESEAFSRMLSSSAGYILSPDKSGIRLDLETISVSIRKYIASHIDIKHTLCLHAWQPCIFFKSYMHGSFFTTFCHMFLQFVCMAGIIR